MQLTDLFNEYDSDDDKYESVNELKVIKDGQFRAKKTASTVKGVPANRIRNVSVTGSLPSIITPYSVAKNFVSSSKCCIKVDYIDFSETYHCKT